MPAFVQKLFGLQQRIDAADEEFHQALVENALRDRGSIGERVASIARQSSDSDERLIAGIERVRASARKPDPMAELVRGMKTAGGHQG